MPKKKIHPKLNVVEVTLGDGKKAKILSTQKDPSIVSTIAPSMHVAWQKDEGMDKAREQSANVADYRKRASSIGAGSLSSVFGKK